MSIRKRRVTNHLRVLRAQRRMTQLALAQKSRINVSMVSLIENEHLPPTQEQRERLARALGVDVDQAFPPAQEAISA